jgi:hypothetical protein
MATKVSIAARWRDIGKVRWERRRIACSARQGRSGRRFLLDRQMPALAAGLDYTFPSGTLS